jgi:hypothetical protein
MVAAERKAFVDLSLNGRIPYSPSGLTAAEASPADVA